MITDFIFCKLKGFLWGFFLPGAVMTSLFAALARDDSTINQRKRSIIIKTA